MFITEFVLDTAQLTFLPDEEEFQDKIAEVIKQFQVYDKLSLVKECSIGVIANGAAKLCWLIEVVKTECNQGLSVVNQRFIL